MDVEARILPGIPPIYPIYRSSPLGRSLRTVLQEFKDLGLIQSGQEEMLWDEFDRAATQHIDELPNGSFNLVRGTLANFQRGGTVRRLLVSPAIIEFPEGTYTTESLEIMAFEGNKKKPK